LLREVPDARPNAANLAHRVAHEVADLEALLEAHPGKVVRVAGVDDCPSPAELASKFPRVFEDMHATPLADIYTHGWLYSVLYKDPSRHCPAGSRTGSPIAGNRRSGEVPA
jgi:hypothetical protein